MKNFKEKTGIILGPYFILAICFPIAYVYLRWLFEIRLRWVVVDEFFLEFSLPALLLGILAVVFLRRRLKIIKSDKGTGGMLMIVIGSIMATTMVAMSYITKAGYELNKREFASQVKGLGDEKYFAIQNLLVDTAARLKYFETTVTGRQSQSLELELFIAAPVYDSVVPKDTTKPPAWYTNYYKKTISNTLDFWDKSDAFKDFLARSDSEWHAQFTETPVYFENMPRNFKRYGIEVAIEKRFENVEDDAVLLSPCFEAFEKRTGNSFLWIFLSFIIGSGVFSAFILSMRVSQMELYRYEKGEPPGEDNLKWLKEFLTPEGTHFTTAILIHLIWIYYAIYSLVFADFIPSGSELLSIGAMSGHTIAEGEYWRLITSIFVHTNFYHVGYSLVGLGIVGHLLEEHLGRWRMAGIFILTGLIASICSVWYYEGFVSCGASGAIFGLFGTSIGLLITKALPSAARLTHFVVLVFYVGISLIVGFFTPQVGNAAHVGGLLSGVLIGVLLGTSRRTGRSKSSSSGNEDVW